MTAGTSGTGARTRPLAASGVALAGLVSVTVAFVGAGYALSLQPWSATVAVATLAPTVAAALLWSALVLAVRHAVPGARLVATLVVLVEGLRWAWFSALAALAGRGPALDDAGRVSPPLGWEATLLTAALAVSAVALLLLWLPVSTGHPAAGVAADARATKVDPEGRNPEN